VVFCWFRDHQGPPRYNPGDQIAPKTLLLAEVTKAYPNHPGTVFIVTLALTPDDASKTEHMRSG